MTNPDRERIERLIAELERICLGDDLTERDFAAVQAAIAQLRADHPAQGERTPAAWWGSDATAAVSRPLAAPATCPNCVDETDCSSVAICRAVDAVYATPLAAQANAVGRAGCEAETEQRRWLSDYTITEQDMTRGAAHLSALSAAAVTLAAVPAMVEALTALFSNAKPCSVRWAGRSGDELLSRH
jgi:hypothetical protein